MMDVLVVELAAFAVFILSKCILVAAVILSKSLRSEQHLVADVS